MKICVPKSWPCFEPAALSEDVTPLAALIREEIRRQGPIGFDRFMELALYHPTYGYYTRKDRDPFGIRGDFYTASQVQPVFGRLIARAVRALRAKMGEPDDFTVVELGAGRGEMAEALQEFRYVSLEAGSILREKITGVVFSNEFFDALPVRVMGRCENKLQERLVDFSGGRFVFTPFVYTPLEDAEPQQALIEVHDAGISWMKKIAAHLDRGFVLTIDYGYTAREALRFPQGSLMSYHRHTAYEDVLADPGERDITSHVPFDVLREAGEAAGLETVRFETMSQFLLRVGESDQFREAVRGGGENALKTLIYGNNIQALSEWSAAATQAGRALKEAPIAPTGPVIKKTRLKRARLSYFFSSSSLLFSRCFLLSCVLHRLILPLHQITHAPERARLCPLYKVLWKESQEKSEHASWMAVSVRTNGGFQKRKNAIE